MLRHASMYKIAQFQYLCIICRGKNQKIIPISQNNTSQRKDEDFFILDCYYNIWNCDRKYCCKQSKFKFVVLNAIESELFLIMTMDL